MTIYHQKRSGEYNTDPDLVPDSDHFVALFKQSMQELARTAHFSIGTISDDVNHVTAIP